MREYEKAAMGRKAESIYTATKKNRAACEKKRRTFRLHGINSSLEEHMKKSTLLKACYVYINGISMPVISA